jgi:hypothetical protein
MLFRTLISLAVLLFASPALLGQEVLISATLRDAASGEPVPFASVFLLRAGKGTVSDEEGRFTVSSPYAKDTLQISCVGYLPLTLPVSASEDFPASIRLESQTLDLDVVEVRERRGKYKRKGNPAVALIRDVIAHKKDNRLEKQPYYEYEVYDKVELDITKISKELAERKALKKFAFALEYMDSSSYNDPVLPFFLQESVSKVYYRKQPRTEKTYRQALKTTNYDDYTKTEALANFINRLYLDIDIYDDQLFLFELEFPTPLADIAPLYYKFYLTDTLPYNGRECYELSFIPNNRYNLGFDGKLFIAADSSFRVLGADMSLLPTINLNFVKDLRIRQMFEQVQDSIWVTSRSEFDVEFKLTQNLVGIRGKRTSLYADYRFHPPDDPQVYNTAGELIPMEGEDEKTEAYWEKARPEPLSESEAGIYEMVSRLKKTTAFKTFLTLFKGFSAGYVTLGPLDVGSLYSVFSFNPVEGARFRLGARTNGDFHPHWRLKGYAAYGTRDRRFKYSGSVGYAFDKEFSPVPYHYLGFTYEQDVRFPGQYLRVLDQDNFFLSLRIGAPADKMVSYEFYRLEYHKEFNDFVTLDLNLTRMQQGPAGRLNFQYYDEENDQPANASPVRTAAVRMRLQYAPLTKWWEGQYNRYPIPGRFPIMTLGYEVGIKGILGGEHNYHHLNLGFRKRFNIKTLGYSVVDISAGKFWGRELPYILLDIAAVNQSIAYHPKAFNLMSFLEFVGDEYISFHLTHNFNGFLFNRIPLLRRLKLREAVGFKLYYGRLTLPNDPDQNRQLIQFTTNDAGIPETYSIEGPPYMEYSVGITNILRFFELHYVQRLNYLDHPQVPRFLGLKGAGFRIGFSLGF